MKNFKFFLGALFVILMFSSCEEDDAISINNTPGLSIENRLSENSGPILIFGRYYGRCLAESCIEIFWTDGNNLLEDTVDAYPSSTSFYNGKFTRFMGSEEINTEKILSNIPSSLFLTKSSFNVVGTPDAGDWGGIYLQYKNGDLQKQWLVDINTRNIPKELRNYILDINKTVDKIQEINNLN